MKTIIKYSSYRCFTKRLSAMVNLKFSPQDDMYTDDAFLTNYRFIFLQDLLNDSNIFF